MLHLFGFRFLKNGGGTRMSAPFVMPSYFCYAFLFLYYNRAYAREDYTKGYLFCQINNKMIFVFESLQTR